ncbi:Hypothetical protein R9X50_00150300 [Acrodontium crateriforme]|uniref:Uncharacterized protein n=1 Tax=Acrodontium crateriforme TaxID=150365 RepID=A0AAQ3R893_9PEZI|nr:Hypothetical protein R9X50_00150300 [Acrodontium crateriforme]
MAPIRRYLRITRYSVLEVRIYLDRPSDAGWLLSERDPVLSRVIEEIRPLVLPRLREENENARKKGGKKKKNIKDVISRDDFEVTIFLTELSTRHSLLTKQKNFSDKPKLKSTSDKLTGWLQKSTDNPIHVEDEEGPVILQEEDGDSMLKLNDIPDTNSATSKRQTEEFVNVDEPLFVSSDDEEGFQTQRERRATKRRRSERVEEMTEHSLDNVNEEGGADDKKKLGLHTSYDGFSIYGRILCLLVKRKGNKAPSRTSNGQDMPGSGSQMMEQWVSTQAVQEGGLDDDEDDG